jgi:8-oxo-dGTP diphosphatase
VAAALTRLQGKVRYQPVGFELLPEKFTLSELQQLYEADSGHHLGQAEFPQKGAGFWPTRTPQGNPDGRSPPAGAVVPL